MLYLNADLSLFFIMYTQIDYYVGVQIDESCMNQEKHGRSPKMMQRDAVGAVKVAIRSLSIGAGTSMS